jgi:Ca2+-binding EF-hand superfamily protein
MNPIPRRSSAGRPGTAALVLRSACTAAALVALGLSLTPPASAQVPPPVPLQERFTQADKNGDGRIDREEFHRMAVESFYFRDKGKKGYLVVEELPETSREAFRAANRKADGRLTLEEYVNALFVDFDKADTGKDGGLTFEEIRVYSRQPR